MPTVSCTVVVAAREGDQFKGVYPSVPTRAQVLEGIRTGSDAVMIARLVAIVNSVKVWPDKVLGRRVETVAGGKIIFTSRRF